MKKGDKLITETKEEIRIDLSWFWKRKFHCVVLLLLITIIALQYIDEPLILIEMKEKPKQEFTCNCNCEYPQQTENIESVPFPSYNWSDINWTWDGVEIYSINHSGWYSKCRTCWNTNAQSPTKTEKQ